MKATNHNDFPIYEDLKSEEFRNALENFMKPIKETSDKYFFIWDEIGMNVDSIIEIVNLIQKRRVYFYIFHEKQMGELNEVSLTCFWILKLRPFHYIPNPRVNVNLIFALNLFKLVIERISKKEIKFPTSHLLHAFKYRDLSKEAIMAIAESLIA